MTLAAGLVAASALPALALDISGAGATFPYPIYAKWADAYKKATGNGMNYQSIGSGGGIAQIKAKTVTFGASDKPLTPAEAESAGLVQFPVVIGGSVAVVNLPGIKSGEMVLDGPTLANIYLGHIKMWNDQAIKKLNPKLNLPAQAIAVVHRSDGSGTTFIWANYLSKVSPDWAANVGAATSLEWPVGIGAKGNEGVAGNVAQTSGAIGYVEYSYATQNHLVVARAINKDGVTVSPSAASFQAAAAKADWVNAKDFYVILTQQAGHDAWPITGSVFVIMYRQPPDAGAAKEALKFFHWAFADGKEIAAGLNYVPMPDSAVQAVEKSWHDKITPAALP
jgi:phosphate transport system substrate-binding protein